MVTATKVALGMAYISALLRVYWPVGARNRLEAESTGDFMDPRNHWFHFSVSQCLCPNNTYTTTLPTRPPKLDVVE